jgi:hypothetical protein
MAADNRCVECGKFKAWEELRLTNFVPDSEFGPEVNEYTCIACKPDLEVLDGSSSRRKPERVLSANAHP